MKELAAEIGCVIPILNQTLTLSASLCGSSPYYMYCLVAARLPSRFHFDGELELPANNLKILPTLDKYLPFMI